MFDAIVFLIVAIVLVIVAIVAIVSAIHETRIESVRVLTNDPSPRNMKSLTRSFNQQITMTTHCNRCENLFS